MILQVSLQITYSMNLFKRTGNMRRPFRTSFNELVDQNKQDLERDADLLNAIEKRVEDRQLRRLKKSNNKKALS